jgi:hypothetical protein
MLRTWLCLSILAAGCDDGGSDDLSGAWLGRWSGGTTTGALTETLTQTGTSVVGTATFSASPCWSTAQLQLVIGANGQLSGTAQVAGSAVSVVATVSGSHMAGTFAVPTGLCTGTGSFTLDRH